MPAFALSRFEPPGKRYIFALLLTGLMLPQQTVLIPLYDMLRWLHLFDTRIGLIIVHGVYGMPSQILILRGFMTTIPRDIEKAAQIEGATDFQIFTKVILPLAVPGIVVGYTLNFIAIWKEFVFALVFLNSESIFPVTVGMLKLNSDRYISAFNLPSAGLVISQIPIVILFIFAYRWISSGNFRRLGQGLKGQRKARWWPTFPLSTSRSASARTSSSRASISKSRTARSWCWSARQDAARQRRST